MPEVVLYTTESCGYCLRARSLLQSRGVVFREQFVPRSDESQWDELYKKSGLKTIPQIWLGDKLIGGYTDLVALDITDGLASLKAT